jgi:hypothetical protein
MNHSKVRRILHPTDDDRSCWVRDIDDAEGVVVKLATYAYRPETATEIVQQRDSYRILHPTNNTGAAGFETSMMRRELSREFATYAYWPETATEACHQGSSILHPTDDDRSCWVRDIDDAEGVVDVCNHIRIPSRDSDGASTIKISIILHSADDNWSCRVRYIDDAEGVIESVSHIRIFARDSDRRAPSRFRRILHPTHDTYCHQSLPRSKLLVERTACHHEA